MRVAGLVLAAGRATRMGGPKVTLELDGRALVRWAADALAGAGCAPLLVVTGPDTPDLAAALAGRDAVRIDNPEARSGMASSLQAGLRALPAEAEAAVVALGDQPGIDDGLVAALLRRHAAGRPAIVVPSYRGFWGNPVLLDRAVWPEVAGLAGDTGARPLILRDPGRVAVVDFDREAPADIDTPEAYRQLLRTTATDPGTGLGPRAGLRPPPGPAGR